MRIPKDAFYLNTENTCFDSISIKQQDKKMHGIIYVKCSKCNKIYKTTIFTAQQKNCICPQCTSKQVFLDKYGVDNPAKAEKVKQKTKETNIERYGAASAMKTAVTKENLKKSFIDKYGVDNPFRLSKNRHLKNHDDQLKAEATCLQKYGNEHYFKSDDFKEKSKSTCIKKYGVDHIWKSPEIQERISETNEKKYGGPRPLCDPKVNKKSIKSARASSQEKKMMEMLTNRGFYYEYNYPINGKLFDFALFNDKEKKSLNTLIEIDGEYWHGLLSDPDFKQVRGETDDERFYKTPSDVKLLVLDAHNIDTCISEIMDNFNCSYSDFINNIINTLPKDFPYPKYEENRMLLDWKHLKEYINVNRKQFLGTSVIKNFHKSIFTSHVGTNPSPVEAWSNKSLLEKCVRNRFIYSSSLSSQKIADGFNICKIAPKVSVFNPCLAKELIEKYLNDYSSIFDPFSGFSGRMLGTCSLGKKYIGQDINKEHVEESNEIIKFLNLDATVSQKDLFESSGEYECLFTCPPYNLKETWNNESQANLSCDEWIDECLKRFKCKKYMFVVDKTEKYKDKIVEEIKNKSHFNENSEYVVLI
jgi:hypothetical protein